MPGRTIKQEPARARTSPTPSKFGTANRPSTTVTSTHGSDMRHHVRSGAPSVDTRFGQQPVGRHQVVEITDTDDEENPLMLEYRQLMKASTAELNMSKGLQANASFVQKGFALIGQQVKQLNDVLGELQSLGIQHVSNLPELVLVGDQSAGKSSLMSAFAGIFFPRSEGACTRCPVHIRLSKREGPWSCKISLQQDYFHNPEASGQVTKKQPFGPWFDQPRVVRDFAVVENMTEPWRVERALRWAQVAILNHNDGYEMYRPFQNGIDTEGDRDLARLERFERDTKTAFSPNTVALDISGPDLPDLSFYDLPGIFNNPKQEGDEYLVKVVENLAAKYIRHEQAIILWAVPMNVDPEISRTFAIIRANKAQNRTVGIMTKADLLPKSNNTQWLAMLRGQQHQVGRGYFITARRVLAHGKDDLGRVGAFEESFFNRTPESRDDELDSSSWPAEFHEFEDRCGVSRLSVFMSQELGKEFAKCLPDIKHKVEHRLLSVEAELALLPDIPQNPEVEVRGSLITFSTELKTCLEGTKFSSELVQLTKKLQTEVINRKPKFVVKAEPVRAQIDLTTHDDETASTLSSPVIGRRPISEISGGTEFLTPTAKRTCNGQGIKSEGIVFGATRNQLFGNQGRPSKSLADVRKIIEAKRTPGMPGLVPDEVYNTLCMEAVAQWGTPMDKFIHSTELVLQDCIEDTLKEAFAGLHARFVYKEAVRHMRHFVKSHMDTVDASLQRLVKMEGTKFYTLDEETHFRHQTAEAKVLERARHYQRWLLHLGEKITEEDKRRKKLEDMSDDEKAQEEKRVSKEAAQLGPDPFKTELGVCAYVRGYYLTAAARFVDYVTLHIVSGLVPDMIDEIRRFYLDQKLGLMGGASLEHFEKLMEEDVFTNQRRQALKDERQRYQDAVQTIKSLEPPPHTVSFGGARSPSQTTQAFTEADTMADAA